MKITVVDDYQNAFRSLDCFQKLNGYEVAVYNDTERDPERLSRRLQDAEIVLLTQQRSPLPRAVIERLPRLKLVSQTGRITSHIDVAACTDRGIIVCAGGLGRPHSTAELTWALILAALRRLPCEIEQLKRGRWQSALGSEVNGKTLGIYAFGNIGAMVAGVGRAFGARVLCWGREASQARAREQGYHVAGDRASFFAEADILCLHIPLNDDTRGIVTGEDLARMKPSALLVNTSRAGLIADGALAEALQAGRPGLAAVDVYEDEPVLGGNHPLLKLDNALCSPHLGYVTRETYEVHYGLAIDQIVAFAAGKPINVINPEAMTRK